MAEFIPCFLIALLAVTDTRMLDPAIGTIAPPRPASAFGAAESTFQLATKSGSVIFIASALIGGAFAVILDLRETLLAAILALVVANVPCALAFTLSMFLSGFAVAGIGASGSGTLIGAIIQLSFDDKDRPARRGLRGWICCWSTPGHCD